MQTSHFLRTRSILLELVAILQRICGHGNMKELHWQYMKQMKSMICTHLICSKVCDVDAYSWCQLHQSSCWSSIQRELQLCSNMRAHITWSLQTIHDGYQIRRWLTQLNSFWGLHNNLCVTNLNKKIKNIHF